MEQKFKVGEELEVSFIGRIMKVEIERDIFGKGEKILYKVVSNKGDAWVQEDCLYRLMPDPMEAK